MRTKRIFFISKSKTDFSLLFKNFIKNLIKFYAIFIVKIKNFKYYEKKINIKSDNIYIITDENLKDYDVNVSKISQIFYFNKLISPLNKNNSLCDELQIEISNGTEIYNHSKIHVNFDVYIKSQKSNKKNYNFYLERKDLKNIILTKKWLKINIKLKKSVNLKKNKVYIKIKKINFDNSYKNKELNFIAFKTLSKKNLQNPKVIFIVLDGISNKDFSYYSNKVSQKKIFQNLIKESFYYTNSITGSTVTGSSIPSLLTNTNLLQHGLFKYESHFYKGSQFPSKNLEFISEKFLECGYNTYALTNFSRLRPHFGMNIGFLDYTNICSYNFYSSAYFEKTIELIKLSENEKSFIFLHYFGGHPPFSPEIYYSDNKVNLNENYFHYSNLAKSELFIESIINHLKQNGIYDNTTLIVTSDHGKTSNNFNKLNYHFNEERLNVPLIYKPRKKNNIKFSNNIISKKTIAYKEIYKLLYKYEKINLNLDFEIKQDNEIIWTTITSDYKNINCFNFIGYSKLFKWVFKYKLEHGKFFITEKPKIFKIISFNYVDEKKNIYQLIDNKTIQKAEISLVNYIKNSQNKNFETEKQYNNYFRIFK
jgi:hypothetical protein